MRTLSNQSPAALAETVATLRYRQPGSARPRAQAILWTKDQPPTTAEVSHTLDGVRRTCGTPFSCLIPENTFIPSTARTVGIYRRFQNSEANCAMKAVHDFSLNALEIVKSIWDDSVFFSNLNQMSLIKLKRGFDEFFWRRGAQTTCFGAPSLAL